MQKEKYAAPIIITTIFVLENGIAAGSAFAKPQTSDDVIEQWETDSDIHHDFEWDW